MGMTLNQMRQALVELGVEFSADAEKPELEEMLKEAKKQKIDEADAPGVDDEESSSDDEKITHDHPGSGGHDHIGITDGIGASDEVEVDLVKPEQKQATQLQIKNQMAGLKLDGTPFE